MGVNKVTQVAWGLLGLGLLCLLGLGLLCLLGLELLRLLGLLTLLQLSARHLLVTGALGLPLVLAQSSGRGTQAVLGQVPAVLAEPCCSPVIYRGVLSDGGAGGCLGGANATSSFHYFGSIAQQGFLLGKLQPLCCGCDQQFRVQNVPQPCGKRWCQ